MSDQQVDLRHVRDNLGHASIATTSIYLHTEDDARHEATEDKHRIGWTHKGIGRPPATPPMTASSRKSYLYFHESEILPKCSCSPDRGETSPDAASSLTGHIACRFSSVGG
ncbi:hypothetical protein CNE_BB1p06160 (plasmid) [Cupriavidus necator N-1]|uniref:Uncharacterized protein n=1 Tax=Cupriavidus necator (strain ATCC 43291 / DSM 13513 / CCUG 52238 / LMG 8453 / N-1) TaxID=1042878 RepID=F8GXG6_CUPNN|nr:hypothetical protein CNE_BB1p06160 [Cupriavidus necator N-1]